MKSIIIYLAIACGLCDIAAAGAHHSYGGNNIYSNYGSYGGSSAFQHRQLVDVPYTVEVRTSRAGSSSNYGGTVSSGRNYGGSFTRNYQYQQPQIQIERAELVHEQHNSFSQPQQRQIVRTSVPRQTYSQVRRVPVIQQRSFSYQPQQTVRRQPQRLVDVPYTVETYSRGGSSTSGGYGYSPYSTGNSFSARKSGNSQYAGVSPIVRSNFAQSSYQLY